MQVIEFNIHDVPTIYQGIALCLGFFDGVHLGHQEIIKEAKNTGLKVGLLSFSTPPAYVIGRKDTLRSLTSVDDKADILESFGVDYLFIMPFDEVLKNTSRSDFINYVLKIMNPKILLCGEDYRFGKDGLGDPNFLAKYFDIKIIPLKNKSGIKYSSKEIRHLIFDGKIKEATSYLGHFYRIAGLVVKGKHNGTSLGFPTANIDLDFPYVIPKNGVYMGYAYVHNKKYKCLISIGTHPTLGALDASIIEVYIFDFIENIYGSFIYVEFVDFIREMITFNSINELITQIRKDKLLAEKELK